MEGLQWKTLQGLLVYLLRSVPCDLGMAITTVVHRVSGDRQRLYSVPVHHHDYPHPPCSELFPGISPRGHTDGRQLRVLLYSGSNPYPGDYLRD